METKKANVIMLPTEDISQVTLNTYINETHNCSNLQFNLKPRFSNEDAKNMGFEYQHLYFTTDEEIKKGDWVLDNRNSCNNFIHQISCSVKGNVRKIVASTDNFKNQLSIDGDFKPLPKPSQAFIEKYCELGGIDEVLVEYNQYFVKGNYSNTCSICKKNIQNTDKLGFVCKSCGLKLKIDSHNTITIHPIKTSWSREEVEAFGKKCFNKGVSEGYLAYPMLYTKPLPKEFVEKTYKEMKEQLITFETAILAKEKGLNISNSGYFYDKKGDKIMDTPLDKFLWGGKYPAPTQSLLQKWLREEHNISVTIMDKLKNYSNLEFIPLAYDVNNHRIVKLDSVNTYEEALEKGLFEALKLIKI